MRLAGALTRCNAVALANMHDPSLGCIVGHGRAEFTEVLPSFFQ